MDEYETALLAAHALQIAGAHPEPVTALEALMWEHREAAAAANEAAASAVGDAVAMAVGTLQQPFSPPHQPLVHLQQPGAGSLASGTVMPGSVALKRRGVGGLSSARQQRVRSPPPRQQPGPETSDQARLSTGLTGTKLTTLPPMAVHGGGEGGRGVGGTDGGGGHSSVNGSDSPLATRSAHLGYYPGLQVGTERLGGCGLVASANAIMAARHTHIR